ncbi:MAG: HAMP domain-containing histidine kinase [Candidatus Azobacteroides sp.]|nr:HAMP domain-containing histidine kinase [Candidatus Azobacteroides sp.]
MKVQTRLSLYSSIVFGIIFTIISLLIYTLYEKNTKKALYINLEKTSYITAWFFLEEDELNKEDFAVIKEQFKEQVLNPFYHIYNAENKISYGSEEAVVPVEYLEEIRKKGEVRFSYDDFICFGMFYKDNQGDFVVITKEKKSVLSNQMNLLLWILGIALCIGILGIIGLSRWMAYLAYKPFNKVISQVQNISTNNLNVSIKSPETKDELQKLIDTFNDLLKRISESFVIQKNFVNYVSHEFKTPLASMLGNLEVFSLKDRTQQEYRELSDLLIKQIYQLEEILNTLIIISDLRENNNSDISTPIRLDEIIWEIIGKIQSGYRNAKILVNISILPEEESYMNITKDYTQLLMALYNLIENAVKYSKDKPVEIGIYKENNALYLLIKDHGIGIPKEQLEYISTPFYRAENTSSIQGSGIGLSIALRILEKNEITYQIESEENKGTNIYLCFN